MTAVQPAGRRWSRVIVTRPVHEAAHWVTALNERGWLAQALPLIEITPPRQAQALAALQHARDHWSQWDALMFVSAAAVRHFFDGVSLQASLHERCGTRFWVPGPGTAKVLAGALKGASMPPDCIDAPPTDAGQFDSEHLWPMVAGQVQPGFRLLVVRGASVAADEESPGVPTGKGRDWLIERCRERGAQVDVCVAYERHAPAWAPQERSAAIEASARGSLWLLSSSQALDHLQSALPQARWDGAAALCTHPRIAQRAREAGFGHVFSSRPALADVLAALESPPESPQDEAAGTPS